MPVPCHVLLTVICNGVDDYMSSDLSRARRRNDSVTPAPYVADCTHTEIIPTESNAKIFNLSINIYRIYVDNILRDHGCVTRRLAWQLYNRNMYCHKDDINVICELLAVKHGDLQLDLFRNSVLDVFIEFLCTN